MAFLFLLAACSDATAPNPLNMRIEILSEPTATQGCSMAWTVFSDSAAGKALYYELWDDDSGANWTGWADAGGHAGRTWLNDVMPNNPGTRWTVGIGPLPTDSVNPDVHAVAYDWKHSSSKRVTCGTTWNGPA